MDFAYNLTNNAHKTQIYYTAGQYAYTLPKGITMVYILCMGAGGGGGGGFTRAAGSAGGGGGGGGTGALTRVVIPKIFLSDSLLILVGTGGPGGAGGNPATAGTAGGQSIVSTNLGGTVSLNNLYIAQANGGAAGNPGTGAAGGTGGAGGTSTTNTGMGMVSLGTFTNRIGITGGDGNATASPLAGVYGTGSIPFSAGRGGGGINAANPGTSANGGSISGRGFVVDVVGGAAAGGAGVNGMFMMKPFVSLGGTGGASNNAGVGGVGGKGGPGCGGGGGGAGTSLSAGGAGGPGGDGLVIITCW
jgi:hypothetical protein